MPPFDFQPALEEWVRAGHETGAFLTGLGQNINLNLQTGTFDFDAAALQNAAVAAGIGQENRDALNRHFAFIKAGGFWSSQGVAAPWAVLEDIFYHEGGVPPTIRGLLGLPKSRPGGEAAAVDAFRNKHPDAPPEIFAAQDAGQVLNRTPPMWQLPAAGPVNLPGWQARPRDTDSGGGWDPDDGRPSAPQRRPGRPALAVRVAALGAPTPEQAQAVLDCLQGAAWGPYIQGQDWSWALGASVFLDRDCAEKLEALLMAFGGGTVAKDILVAVLANIGQHMAAGAAVAAAVGAVSVGTALALYGAALAAMIWLILRDPNVQRVCLRMNWPTPFLAAFIVATPG
jgi:hypothetical protein